VHETHAQLAARGNAKLLLGDWSGWQDREARIYDPAANYLDTNLIRQMRYGTAQWDGVEDISDKVLLVVADGTVGDCLQMLRYVPLLLRSTRKIILRVRPQVASFVRLLFGSSLVLSLRGVAPDFRFDRYAWMLSLPTLIGGLPQPLAIPELGGAYEEGGRNGGICMLEDATDPPGGGWEEGMQSLRERSAVSWIDLRLDSGGAGVATVLEMARMMQVLDCAVTVDAAAAHLGGMMGIPTWVLLTTDAHPRWGMGERTDWYPSVQLCRQTRRGDWTGVITNVAESVRC
jgi:hypothetical protein